MRKFTYLLPAILITGCSVGHQPVKPQLNYAQSGVYDPACQAGACALGQSYPVANYGHGAQGSYGAPHNYQNGYQNQNGYPQAAPTYVTQTGYGYGTGHGPHAAPVLRGRSAYGPPHGLRGAHHRKPGYFYGTLGGVMYDTDINSFGLEGRIGYDSGRVLGAEIEGSVGIIKDKDTVSGIDLESGFDHNIAAFAVARVPVSQRLSFHARGGYDFRSFSVTGTDNMGNTAEADFDFDGFAYGMGGEYAITPRDGLRMDYTRYETEIGATDSISASYIRKF